MRPSIAVKQRDVAKETVLLKAVVLVHSICTYLCWPYIVKMYVRVHVTVQNKGKAVCVHSMS